MTHTGIRTGGDTTPLPPDNATARSVHIEGVTRTYRDPDVRALDAITLDIAAGSFVAVVGASGCGKSTLLHLVGGLDTPSEGTISITSGNDPHAATTDSPPQGPDEMRQSKQIGWMSQQPALLPWRTVRQNIDLAQRINPQPGRMLPEPDVLLEMVGLAEFSDAYPATLSGGMQQRASLARTLSIGAGLWLMDEPFAALDELTRENLADELLTIWRELRPTVVWVTHHVTEAVKLADRIIVLTPRPGRIAASIPIDLPRPRDETSAAFQNVVRNTRAVLRTARDDAGADPRPGREGR